MTRRILLAIWLIAATPLAFAEQMFASPEAALDAMAVAVEAGDQDQLVALFGSEYEAFVHGQESDPALANLRRQHFTEAFREYRSLVPEGDDRYTLIVGAVAWPFPIPIVRSGNEWHFDGAAGVEEMRNRIVGANELNAIALLNVFVSAQRDYALVDHNGDGALEYATRVLSTPGSEDGLYWDADSENSDARSSPLGLLKNLADATLGERSEGAPFLGYRFRLLYSQGPNAGAGALDFRINGHMLAGFAMIAWPAEYGETGVMTFMVNQDQVVYEKDLGEDTAKVVDALASFDPGEGWTAVDGR